MFAELLSGFREARALIEQSGLSFEDGFDEMFGIYENEVLVATGARAGYVLKMLAVDSAWQGGPLLGEIINSLMSRGRAAGHESFFIYTKPDYATTFAALNFRLLASQGKVVLLEYGQGLANWLQTYQPLLRPGRNAAVVMNCNPFTLGHRSLVEYAHNNCDEVIIFAVQEDRSIFPFSDRFSLIKQGVRDMKGVEVISGGDFIISNATFPTYFIKGTDELAAQTKLDATVFATRIAPALNITVRFVGEEPTDKTTMAYNNAMREVFAANGIELKEIPREQKGNQIVSASTVRKALAEDDWETVYRMVPKTTLIYLKSPAGQEVIRKIKMTEAFKKMEAEEKAKEAAAAAEAMKKK